MKTARKISRLERRRVARAFHLHHHRSLLYTKMEHMSVVRFEIRRYLMIGHVWNGVQENHSSPKIRLRLGTALHAWLLCILSIHLSHVQSRNTRHHTHFTAKSALFLLVLRSGLACLVKGLAPATFVNGHMRIQLCAYIIAKLWPSPADEVANRVNTSFPPTICMETSGPVYHTPDDVDTLRSSCNETW